MEPERTPCIEITPEMICRGANVLLRDTLFDPIISKLYAEILAERVLIEALSV